jgi:hypothetical protein
MALTKISGNVVQQNNFTLSGVVTATSFTGDLTGNVTGTATTATNLADGANITTGTISNDRLPATITKNLTGDVTGNLTGNVSSSGANTLGSLTVTNDATVGGALTITGNLTVNGTTTTIDTVVTAIDSLAVDGDVTAGGNLNITGVSTFGGNVDLGDNDKLRFGAGYDLEIYSDGTNGIIKDTNTSGGDLRLLSDVVKLMNSDGTKVSFKGIEDGAAELYYNNSRKLETTGYGVAVSGGLNVSGVSTFQGNVDLGDNDILRLGAGPDLQIYHNGSHSYIDETGTGNLYIRNGTKNSIWCQSDGQVNLYYNDDKKFETTLNGAKVTGDLNVTGILTVGQSSVTIDGTNNKITTPKLDYAGISSSIADTAVDIFVYDTSKDSDGGAWRKRTQHTSWYNEELNTATRGSRREFPAVAVIVLDDLTSTGRMTIYDGDNPDLPMWMVFTGNSSAQEMLPSYDATKCSCLSALNGQICVGNSTYDLEIINFLKDNGTRISNAGQYINKHNISIRNSALASLGSSSGTGIVNRAVNDVAMTVLPNAPIDSATGLPIPTIAVATDGGVSVIKDDGNVYDLNIVNRPYSSVYFSPDNLVWAVENPGGVNYDLLRYFEIPSADITVASSYGPSSNPALFPTNTKGNIFDSFAYGSPVGLTKIDHADGSAAAANGLVAYATTSYNTGWMHGDIKGAFLSDTDATNVTATSDNLIINGGFADASNWNVASGWTISGGVATNNGTGGTNQLSQAVSMDAGKQYILNYEVTAYTSGTLQAYFNGTWTTVPGTVGTHGVSFTASASVQQIYFAGISGTSWTGSLDNVSLSLAGELDRSVNGKGLQVFGTITKSAVATGAELVAYSGWNDVVNNLYQPYNSDLDFGTNDFSIMLWANHPIDASANAHSTYISHTQNGTPPTNGDWIFRTNGSDGYLTFYTHSGGTWYSTQYATSVPASTWYHTVAVRRSGTMYLYIDGKEVANGSLNYNVDTTNGIRIGVRYGNTNSYGYEDMKGSMSLLRISASAPSAEQIKKIYEDEKVLFQENAACALYGSSDSVTALAYDDSTNLLYAGTSSGRSDFQGLRRINNTTTAVTTAISASNGLVAEQ